MKNNANESLKYLDFICRDAARINPTLASTLHAHILSLLKENTANVVLQDIWQSSLFHEYEAQAC